MSSGTQTHLQQKTEAKLEVGYLSTNEFWYFSDMLSLMSLKSEPNLSKYNAKQQLD